MKGDLRGKETRRRDREQRARARAEDLVVRVEDTLNVCAGTDDYTVLPRTIKALRASVLAPPR